MRVWSVLGVLNFAFFFKNLLEFALLLLFGGVDSEGTFVLRPRGDVLDVVDG